MRILHITPSFQHPAVRGPHRHYHFLRELSQRHHMTLLTLIRSDVPAQAMEEVASYTERVLTFDANGTANSRVGTVAGSVPVVGGRMERALHVRQGVEQMKRAFQGLVEREAFDVLLFHGKSVFPVIDGWNDLPIVIDFCDATSMRVRTKIRYARLAKRPLLLMRYIQVRQIETKLIEKTPHVGFISPRDREAILGPDDRSVILPNGVDLRYWQRQSEQVQPNCLVLHGVMDYAPNADAAIHLMDNILPLVRRSIPELEVYVVGRNPTAALREKAGHYPDVTVTGFVDDMRPYLERAAVYAAPLRYASGMQNKLLEAMAMAVPVVTTSVAAAGLRINEEEKPPVRVADGDQEFAEYIIHLLRNEAERSRLASEGRRFIESNFSWARTAEKLEQMCVAAVEERRGRTTLRSGGLNSYSVSNREVSS